MRVVFDTNVLLSAFIFGGNPAKLFDLARSGDIHLITSTAILKEFAAVLKAKFAWEDDDVAEAIKTVGYSSELVKPMEKIAIISDDADNRILECATAGKADFIVSGDRHLLDCASYKGIRIISAREFLDQL